MFALAQKALFQLEPEAAHALTLKTLSAAACLAPASRFALAQDKALTLMGLRFANRIGLAAGADKNGQCIDGFGLLGFGFLELGGVTPKAQSGNPAPRMFRLPQAGAVINRLGFNNLGVDFLAAQLSQHRKRGKYQGILGVNLGKNKDTPNENALSDYAVCYEKLHGWVDFATINVSSPNTANLRALQDTAELKSICQGMKALQTRLANETGKYVPLSVKIAPDMLFEQARAMADVIHACGLDAITATNTTVARELVSHLPYGNEIGGLSGEPVRAASTAMIQALSAHLQGALPIIGVGGISSAAHAAEKLEAGASLVQFYTGLIYKGPQLVKDCIASAA